MSTRPYSKPYLVIAAIDFGTTCTGYAYHVRKEGPAQVRDINIDQAWHGSAEVGLQAPTSVLMNPDKKFFAFGFEAESKYQTLSLTDEHKRWFYFKHFKMKLHHESTLSRDTLIEDVDGKPMRALLVFAEAIKYIKDHLITKLNEALRTNIGSHEIQWVLTVPAIWRESAKQFMRESATKAGIPNQQLLLALEPESAAIFCKELAINRTGGVHGEFLRAFDPGQKYIVVDCGGGTVDTTGHEVQEDGTLKELHAATGGPWGGQLVNEGFETFIENMITKPVLDKFRDDWCNNWIELQKDFEKNKRQFTPNTDQISLNFPIEMENIFRTTHDFDLQKRLENKEYKENVQLIKHCLILKKNIINGFFDRAVSQIKQHIVFLLKKKELKAVSSLLLVGGFSESPMVSAGLRSSFKNLRVVSPENGSVAILKGAVMFGLNQNVIAARISPYTYGVHTRKLYNPDRHDKTRMRKSQGKLVVDNAFDKHLEIGECVYVGEKRTEKRYITIPTKKTKDVYWKVYQSLDKDPKFCDDQGCKYLGKLSITVPESHESERLTLIVSMTCRGTELEATVIDQTNNLKCMSQFEFLDIDTGSCSESQIESDSVEP